MKPKPYKTTWATGRMRKKLGLPRSFKPPKPRRKKVVIEVQGGVAYVAKCPRGVEVQIIDHDNEKCQ